MKAEQSIADRVEAAQSNVQIADDLIGQYLPFIKAETAKFLKRPPVEGNDDELSIAMMAFHEAILGYSKLKGTFLKYASLLIKNRLIDYHRKERRHRNVLSLDLPDEENNGTLADTIADEKIENEDLIMRDATKQEIEELSCQMQNFGVSLSDVVDHCPKQARTLESCQRALWVAREDKALLDDFLRTKRLPIAIMAEGSGVERKTLERHRKYLVALLLIYTNGYEIIRGHLKQVWRGGAVQ